MALLGEQDVGIFVSTGGFIEHVLTQGEDAVRRYVTECKKLGFDIIEISAGFISIPTDDWLRLIPAGRILTRAAGYLNHDSCDIATGYRSSLPECKEGD